MHECVSLVCFARDLAGESCAKVLVACHTSLEGISVSAQRELKVVSVPESAEGGGSLLGDPIWGMFLNAVEVGALVLKVCTKHTTKDATNADRTSTVT